MSKDTESTDADQVDEDAPAGYDEAKRAALDAAREAADAATDGSLVEARTADTHATKVASTQPDDQHVKVFVIPGDGEKPTAKNYDHDANIAATRQYMMSQGLRPTGDVVFKGAEPFGPGGKSFGPGGKSWALTYAVEAVPAERFDFQQVGVLDQQEGAKTPDELQAEADAAEADKKAEAEKAAADEAAKKTAAK